jgi:hypothetical protein
MSFLRDEELGQVSIDTSSDGSDVGDETRQQEGNNSHDQEDTDSEEEEEFGWREGDEAKTRELAREVLQKTLPLQRYQFLKVRFRMHYRRFVLFYCSWKCLHRNLAVLYGTVVRQIKSKVFC